MKPLVAMFAATAIGVSQLGCANPSRIADADVARLPGPTLEGPDVIQFPLGPYRFKPGARKELRQGRHHPEGGCSMTSSGVIRPGDAPITEITVAEDPKTCRSLVVIGTERGR